MGFSRQEYWSGLPFPSSGDLPNPEIEPRSPALQANDLPTELWGKPYKYLSICRYNINIEIKYVNDFLKCNKNNPKTNILLLETKNYKVNLPFQRASITSQSSSRTNSLAQCLNTAFSIPKSNINCITIPHEKLAYSFCTYRHRNAAAFSYCLL